MIKELDSSHELEEALHEQPAVFYKHSPRCWMSARAMRHIKKYTGVAGAPPVYLIDVIAQREPGCSRRASTAPYTRTHFPREPSVWVGLSMIAPVEPKPVVGRARVLQPRYMVRHGDGCDASAGRTP